MEKYNGNPNVVISDPEIHHIRIKDEDNHDFIALGCDGIFDRLSTDQACQEIWTAQMNNLLSFTATQNRSSMFNEGMFH